MSPLPKRWPSVICLCLALAGPLAADPICVWRIDAAEGGKEVAEEFIDLDTEVSRLDFVRAGEEIFWTASADHGPADQLWTLEHPGGIARKLLEVDGALWPLLGSPDGRILLRADSASDDRGVWVSDGTAAGTFRLLGGELEARPDPMTLSDRHAVLLGGRALFAGAGDSLEVDLWTTDGTDAGTLVLEEIRPPSSPSLPRNLLSFRGRLLAVAPERLELWSTDGSGVGEVLGEPIDAAVAGASEDSGLFWFFASTNWELLVKVLDGCSENGHYWVLAAATTNVEYTLTVTDTQTGETFVAQNPLGRNSPAAIDTRAFGTCPQGAVRYTGSSFRP